MRKGGLSQLREELEAGNGGVDIPAEIRWLGGAKARTRYQETQCGTSQWWPLSLARRFSTACAGAEPGHSRDGMRSVPNRRRD